MPIILADEGSYITINNLNLHNKIDKVAPVVYRIGIKDEELILIKDREKFSVPTKRYGKHDIYKRKIMSKWGETPGTMGVLLTGLKGSGKSLLAEDMINEGMAIGFPCLMITADYQAAVIKKMIQAIGPCMVYFDEFGKYYEDKDREKMLTLFSDTDLKRVMFIVTANHQHELSDFMIHRPGRFLWKINYDGMDEEAIMEVIEELKIETRILEYILDYCKSHRISFDVLRVLATVASNSRDLKEYQENIRIHNVPDPVYAHYGLLEMTWKGEEWKGDTYIKQNDDGTLTVEVRDPKTAEVLDSGHIDWTVAKKTITNEGSREYRVVVSDTITIKISRHLSPYKPSGPMQMTRYPDSRDGQGNKRKRGPQDPNMPMDPWNRGEH